MTWTSERDAELLILFDSGLSGAQIAEIFGVTRNAVCGRKWRLGLRGGQSVSNPFSKKDVSTLIKMRRAGRQAAEIAKVLKRSEAAIYWKAHKLGITRSYSMETRGG